MCIGEQVTGGELKVNLAINKIPFISTNLDLCSTISQAGLKCPISAGSQTFTFSQQIPDEAPSVRLTEYKLYMYTIIMHTQSLRFSTEKDRNGS